MFAIEVELLTGRYAATAHDDRHRAEWPPHPARLFSALVAALHEQGTPQPKQREALLWLEAQPAPSLDVSLEGTGGVGRRTVQPVYVPVNDATVLPDLYQLERGVDEARARLAAASATAASKLQSAGATAARAALKKAQDRLASIAATDSGKATKQALLAALALMPAHRTRQVRTFPVFTPRRPVLAFGWPDAPPSALRAALAELCAQVTRLGHSSSLVRCCVVDKAVMPTLVPSDRGDHVLRVVGAGQLGRLEREFAHHQGTFSRVLPALPQRYARVQVAPAAEPVRTGWFSDDWIVFERVGGSRLRSSRGTDLARALRAAVLQANGEAASLPPSLSGHREDGTPGNLPHLAFIACPDVGHAHAEAAVMGCAIVLPHELAADARLRLMGLIARWEMGRGNGTVVEVGSHTLPAMRLERVVVSTRRALQPGRWCRSSSEFVTATPIALDRNPGNLQSRSPETAAKASIAAQECIATACERIGLPRPIRVEVSLAPLLQGAQPAGDFRPWPGKLGSLARTKVHARIEFAQQVQGPVLLGAGRHFGLGLCLPTPARGGDAWR